MYIMLPRAPKDTTLIRTELFDRRGVLIRGGLLYCVGTCFSTSILLFLVGNSYVTSCVKHTSVGFYYNPSRTSFWVVKLYIHVYHCIFWLMPMDMLIQWPLAIGNCCLQRPSSLMWRKIFAATTTNVFVSPFCQVSPLATVSLTNMMVLVEWRLLYTYYFLPGDQSWLLQSLVWNPRVLGY